MTEARVGYHKEVKTASFQGKSITVEKPDPRCSLPKHGTSASVKLKAVCMRSL